jgi:putative ABC transport system permease protein
MLLRILRESFLRNKKRKLIAATATTFGTGIATALLIVAVNIGDKISRELKRYGANLVLLPQEDTLPVEIAGVDYSSLLAGGSLREADLPSLKQIFWRNNILGFVPELPTRAKMMRPNRPSEMVTLTGVWFDQSLPLPDEPNFRTGLRRVVNYWQITGQWISDSSQHDVMVGSELARRFNLMPGDSIRLDGSFQQKIFAVAAIIETGGAEEQQIFAPLSVVQQLSRQPGKIKKILISALTNPEDEFARKPIAQMTHEEYDKWFCTPYASSIAHQLREAVPGAEVRIIRQVVESEGLVLRKISLLMFLIALATFCTSVLGVTSTMTTTVLERRKEVGLFRALGAEPRHISGLFLSEALMVGLLGGLWGCVLGHLVAQLMSRQIFGAALHFNFLSVPIALVMAVLIAMLGSMLPLRKAYHIDPIVTLHSV